MMIVEKSFSLIGIFVIFLLLSAISGSDNKINFHGKWLQGYGKTIKGIQMQYHSCQKDITNALICRQKQEYSEIIWESQPIPESNREKAYSFIWAFGINRTDYSREFLLDINQTIQFQIKTPGEAQLGETVYHSETGAVLTLKTTLIDHYNDCFGYALLSVPAEHVKKGETLEIKVSGEEKNEMTWFMIYENNIIENANLELYSAIKKENGNLYQAGIFSYIHLGSPDTVTISSKFIPETDFPVQFGYNSFPIKVNTVNETKSDSLKVERQSRNLFQIPYELKPVKNRKIYIVQHSHTDIGYTRNATEILADQIRYIDYALDYCELTDHYPENARFYWTCESAWAVREFLQNRPQEQVSKLLERIREGRIEITAMLFNMSDIADESIYNNFFAPLKLFKDLNIPVTSAMQNDINGAAWCLPDFFHQTGIKYLTMGQHGHRALSPFDKPTAFWWQAPSGNKILAFRADHYNTGNFIGFHLGNFKTVETKLFDYIKQLTEKKYPYDDISIQLSGYFTDNSPPSMKACELVKKWNEVYETPQLVLSTASVFLKSIEEKYSGQLETIQKSWPDWWTDGFGSAAYETSLCRKNQALFRTNKSLTAFLAFMKTELPEDFQIKLENISQSLLFYSEHTFGASESITDPLCENSYRQWMEKSSFVYEASKKNKLYQEQAMGILQSIVPKQNKPGIIVFNPSPQERISVFEIYIDHEILPPNKPVEFISSQGEKAKGQIISSRTDGSHWRIISSKLPAFGYETYQIKIDSSEKKEEYKKIDHYQNLTNQFYELSINENGEITLLYDKELKKQLIDTQSERKLGSWVYETLGNRAQMERYTLTDYQRKKLENIHFEWAREYPLWTAAKFSGINKTAAGDDKVEWTIKLNHEKKEIAIEYKIKKIRNHEPEAIYIAFPFSLPEGKFFYQGRGGIIEAGKGQIPGSSMDWQTVQNYLTIRNSDAQVIVSCPEIPLVQFGEINTGKFQYETEYKNTHFYSWVMNNYWTTNFRAFQEGEIKWTYFITSTKDISAEKAESFGDNTGFPVIARVIPPGKSNHYPLSHSLCSDFPSSLSLISAEFNKESVIIQIREISGKKTFIKRNGIFSNPIQDISYTGKIIKDYPNQETIQFAPFENKWLKIEF